MGNNGRLTRKQIKGILASSSSGKEFVQESDVNAIMRRMDADGDEELSFSDFFTSLLPYFIFGDLKQPPTTNELAE
jgi:Ca2+-binding EF-hand superfamily protein